MATTKIQGHSSGSGSVTITAPNTNSNRTLTLPDGDVTLPVTNSGTTLTTAGDILYQDGSGLQRLAAGGASKTLKMNSSNNAPEWVTVATPTAPAMVKLTTFETTEGDNVQNCNINGHFTSDYDTYLLIANVYPDDSNSDFSYRLMSGGSVVTASEYVGSSFRSYNDTADNNQLAGGSGNNPSAGDYNNPEAGMYPHADDMVDGEVTKTSTLELWLYNPLSTTEWGRFKSQFFFHAAGNLQMMYQHGALQNTAALSGVSIYMENTSADIVCKGALYGLTI